MRRVVLDYELKRDDQRFLHERNRGRKDCDGRPDREPEEIARWVPACIDAAIVATIDAPILTQVRPDVWSRTYARQPSR